MSTCQDPGRAVGGSDSDDGPVPRCLLECVFSFFPSDKFTRFCQWKNVELNIHVSGFRELACQGTLGKCSGQGFAVGPTKVTLGGGGPVLGSQ